MSSLEKIVDELFILHNRIRKSPQSFIPYLIERKKRYSHFIRYHQHLYYPFNQYSPITTYQGIKAVDQAIEYLLNTKPMNQLQWNYGLHLAADAHSTDAGTNNLSGHSGSDGSTMQKRVQRYCKWYNHIAENIEIGSIQPLQIILNLIIDDGLLSRGDRKNILSPQFRYIGIGVNPHVQYSLITVITYASYVESLGSYQQLVQESQNQYNQQKQQISNFINQNSKTIQSKQKVGIQLSFQKFNKHEFIQTSFKQLQEKKNKNCNLFTQKCICNIF